MNVDPVEVTSSALKEETQPAAGPVTPAPDAPKQLLKLTADDEGRFHDILDLIKYVQSISA